MADQTLPREPLVEKLVIETRDACNRFLRESGLDDDPLVQAAREVVAAAAALSPTKFGLRLIETIAQLERLVGPGDVAEIVSPSSKEELKKRGNPRDEKDRANIERAKATGSPIEVAPPSKYEDRRYHCLKTLVGTVVIGCWSVTGDFKEGRPTKGWWIDARTGPITPAEAASQKFEYVGPWTAIGPSGFGPGSPA